MTIILISDLRKSMHMTGRSYTSSADQRYKFTGKERDASTGLDYFGKRYYDSWKGSWDQVDPMGGKYPGWSSYNYVEDNPINLVDSTGEEPGSGDDPSTFVTQYVQGEYNSLWNTGGNLIYNFTYNTLPIILDGVSYATVLYAPEISTTASLGSVALTIVKNTNENNGVVSKESIEGSLTTAIGIFAAKSPEIRAGATVLQLGLDAVNFKLNNSKSSKNKVLKLTSGYQYNNDKPLFYQNWITPIDHTNSAIILK